MSHDYTGQMVFFKYKLVIAPVEHEEVLQVYGSMCLSPVLIRDQCNPAS